MNKLGGELKDTTFFVHSDEVVLRIATPRK
ncbi:hypothetical protein LmYK1_02920 [Ligilactobacillus murinus]|nr:hypothetical protein LmYK1_02920 [Ligilactobacillus murinus]